MQKNNLNLRICGVHLLNPYKTVVSHLKRGVKMSYLQYKALNLWVEVRVTRVNVTESF